MNADRSRSTRPRTRPRAAGALLVLTVLGMALAGAPAASGAAETCSPTPTYDPAVTPPSQAIPGFPFRRATTLEINAYYEQVAAQSARVHGGTFATSWKGTDLRYALVGSEANIAQVDQVAANERRLSDPRITTPAEAAALAASTPAIAWYSGNVHGNEPSGADAAIQILYELAARTDCEVEGMLDNLVVGLIPTQNPDGRDGASRTNAYNFDMNRDWFARTQPETDGKVALLEQYPPVLYVDAHEMGSSSFFFPPNADPIYHEISPQSVGWINDLYGPALAAAFDEQNMSDPANWDHFSYQTYDLFYMGYGDTVPTTGFTAAGMTFEKGSVDPDHQREIEQFTAGWTALKQASDHKQDILNQYYDAHVTAVQEGADGQLEPNEVFEPGNTVQNEVPDLTVRNYFLPGTADFPDVTKLVNRLLGMDVEVYRLRQPVNLTDLHAYGRDATAGTVPAGSYWIPMEQPQKRWVQAMLGENTYVPFPYFYDVTAWSNPLLMNLGATFTGEAISPRAARVLAAPSGRLSGPAARAAWFTFPGDTAASVAAALDLARQGLTVSRLADGLGALPAGSFVVENADGAPDVLRAAAIAHAVRIRSMRGSPPAGTPFASPKVALYAPAGAGESLGHLRYVLDQVWGIPYTAMNGGQITAGALTTGDYDVLIVPGVSTSDLALAGNQIKTWIQGGGVYVGTARPGASGGTNYAISQGLTTATQFAVPGLQIPGTLFRVALNHDSPLTLGAPDQAYWYHLGERALTASTTGVNAGAFPASEPDFWYSGYAAGAGGLKGTTALVDETYGGGRVLLFSGEPNYRAYTEGTGLLLANAIAYPAAAAVRGTDVASPAAAAAAARAVASAEPSTAGGRPIRIEVPANREGAALAVLHRFIDAVTVERARGSSFLVVANPAGLDVEQHPFIYRLLPALQAAGVPVRSAIL